MLSLVYHTYTHIFNTLLDGGGYPAGGYSTGYVTTAVVPAVPLGGYGALGGGYGAGYGGLTPKIRAIFIPQGGGAVGGGQW